jgi:Putative transposase
LAPPEQKDVIWVAKTVATRIQSLLEMDLVTDNAAEEPWFAALYCDSVGNRVRIGPGRGRRTVMTYGPGGPVMYPDQLVSIRCANVEGFSVPANVGVRANDCKGLESLCKYAGRPPLAHERLQETSGGKLIYRMKTPWPDGATHVVMERIDLIEKLAALVSRPRYHTIHYYGVLTPAAKWRREPFPISTGSTGRVLTRVERGWKAI